MPRLFTPSTVLALVIVTQSAALAAQDDAQLRRALETRRTIGSGGLPTRAFLVEGGSIALRAGVMHDPQIQPLATGKLRYPTRYFVTGSNETAGPVWVDTEWRFPGDTAELVKGERVESGGSFYSWRDAFDVIEAEPISLHFAVYADDRRTITLGSEATFMRFDKVDREAFLKTFSRSTGLHLISGWPEMGGISDSIPGTLADPRLQRDVQLRLWKEESKQHRDCRHETVGVERARLDRSAIFAAIAAADSATAARLLEQAHDTTHQSLALVERWLVRSCDFMTTYEVLLAAASSDDIDIAVRKVHQEPANGQ